MTKHAKVVLGVGAKGDPENPALSEADLARLRAAKPAKPAAKPVAPKLEARGGGRR